MNYFANCDAIKQPNIPAGETPSLILSAYIMSLSEYDREKLRKEYQSYVSNNKSAEAMAVLQTIDRVNHGEKFRYAWSKLKSNIIG